MKKTILTFIAFAEMFSPFVIAQDGYKIDFYTDIKMRDGITLSSRTWRPDNDAKVPTVFVMTPYIADNRHRQGQFFASNDYAFIAVNQRGRGESEGEFTPLQNIAYDGCDVIDWIKKQPWSDGQVVMHGGSYTGMTQWQIAAKCSDKLSAIAPVAPVYPGEDFPIIRNEYIDTYPIHWLAYVSGNTSNSSIFFDNDYLTDISKPITQGDKSFADLDELYGLKTSFFDLWLNQIGDGSLWDADNPTAEEMAKIDLPIMSLTGHFDADQPGTLRYYREHMAAAKRTARDKHFLIMGPWTHRGTRNPAKEHAGLSFGENSLVNMQKLHLDFYNWALKGGERPSALKDQVTYYTMNTNEWYSAKELESISSRALTLYFSDQAHVDPDVNLPAFKVLEAPSRLPAHIPFKSDPLTTFKIPEIPENYLTDSTMFEIPNSFYVQSGPIDEAVTLSGQWELVLYLEMDAPDADIITSLSAIRPDGTTVNINGTLKRARFRQGAHKEELVKPGQILEYRFAPAKWHSVALEAGTQFRVQIAPAIFPSLQKNFNSGKKLGHETKDDARIASIKVHMSEDHPSRIIIPIE